MNDYDDSDDYSSSNSFRARSNTWPLNRPDLALPNGVCIDETLPEIELEEDDLFTTNENWSTGLVDHDIMSWDPILNAQNLHHQPTQAFVASTTTTTTTNTNQTNPLTQSATIHHHHQPQQQQQQQQQQHTLHQHHQHHHQQPHQQQHHHHQHQSQQQQQPHESLLSGSSIIVANQSQHQPHDALLGGGSNIIAGAAQCQHQQSHQHHLHHHQQQQQIPPQAPQHQQPQQQQHHQTLNNTHCLEQDDPNEYHIQQLHHLRLDNNQDSSEHQTHYISSLSTSSVCIQSSTASLGGPTENYNISSDHPSHHHHHQLQPLTSARYDLDQHNDLDLKTLDNEKHHHHLHHLTSTSLDHHTSGSHMLSSSLSTSGICLSGDLEDLDYKGLDPSQILQANHLEDPGQQDQQLDQQQQQLQQGDNGGIGAKQSNSASKTKLNTPRRNAWGNMSYADLISQAINSTNDKRLTLSQIYDWMVQHVPYFKDKGDSNSSAGWKNSVRHNLSLHNRFKRLQNEGAGKSSWWTINPEANVGKCARRRAASMEASKYEKKRGRAKKKADAIRQGLVSYPSLTNSSLNGSTGNLEQSQPQPCNQFGPQQQPTQPQQATDPNLMDQKQNLQQDLQQQQQPQHQQPQHQQVHGLNSDNLHNRQPNTGLYVAPSQEPQYDQSLRYHHYELSTPL